MSSYSGMIILGSVVNCVKRLVKEAIELLQAGKLDFYARPITWLSTGSAYV